MRYRLGREACGRGGGPLHVIGELARRRNDLTGDEAESGFRGPVDVSSQGSV